MINKKIRKYIRKNSSNLKLKEKFSKNLSYFEKKTKTKVSTFF